MSSASDKSRDLREPCQLIPWSHSKRVGTESWRRKRIRHSWIAYPNVQAAVALTSPRSYEEKLTKHTRIRQTSSNERRGSGQTEDGEPHGMCICPSSVAPEQDPGKRPHQQGRAISQESQGNPAQQSCDETVAPWRPSCHESRSTQQMLWPGLQGSCWKRPRTQKSRKAHVSPTRCHGSTESEMRYAVLHRWDPNCLSLLHLRVKRGPHG